METQTFVGSVRWLPASHPLREEWKQAFQDTPFVVLATESQPKPKTGASIKICQRESGASEYPESSTLHPRHSNGYHGLPILHDLPEWDEQRRQRNDLMHTVADKIKDTFNLLTNSGSMSLNSKRRHAEWTVLRRWGDVDPDRYIFCHDSSL
jgi:hypothetical protein